MNAAPATPGKHHSRPIRGVETFAVGSYPGDAEGEVWDYTPADLDTIVRNFSVLSSGENPIHKVPVVQTHDRVDAHGWVSSVEKTGELLLTDWDHVSDELRRKVRDKRLAKVSPEIKRDFTDKDGKVYPGPYLYRVAVIGADVPRVKGLDDVRLHSDPKRWPERVFRFSDKGLTMDRAKAIQFLTDAGVDPSTITDAVPDATLIAVAIKWDEDARQTPVPVPIAQPVPVATPPPTPANQPPMNTPVQNFADPAVIKAHVEKTVAELVSKETAKLTASIAAENTAREQRASLDRQAAVRMFCDARAKEGRITPAENDEGSPLSVRARLLRLAASEQTVHRFADPATKKEVVKTELELQQDEIASREPRRFSERVKADGKLGTQTPADPFAAKVAAHYDNLAKRREQQAAANRNPRNN